MNKDNYLTTGFNAVDNMSAKPGGIRFISFRFREDVFGMPYFGTIFLILVFLEPSYFAEATHLSVLDSLLTYAKMALCLVGIAFAVLQIIRGDKILAALSLFVGVLLVESLFLPKGSPYICFVEFGVWIPFYILLKQLSDASLPQVLRAASTALLIYIVINFATELAYQISNGDALSVGGSGQPHWFLGHKNLFVLYFLLATGVTALLDQNNEMKISLKTVLIIVFSVASSIVGQSSTGLFVYLLFLVILYTRVGITPAKTFVAAGACFVAFVLLRLQYLFSWVITSVMNKSLSFTGRTEIWDMVIEAIGNNLVFGVGVNKTDVIGFLFQNGMYHGHDLYLYLTYQGGLLCVFCLVVLVVVIIQAIRSVADKQACFVIAAALACYAFYSVFDYSYLPHMVLFVAVLSSMHGFDSDE